MSITNELRRYISGPAKIGISHICEKAIANIADRIDAEHESACAEAYGNGVESVALPDMTAYVKLPVDVDGEVIHVGDMMERGKARGYVIALMLSKYPKKWGGALHWSVQLEGEQAPTALDAFFKHYHEPNVDDLLFSYGQACIRASNEAETEAAKQTMLASLRHEYAVKLRMVGNGKEQQ